MTQSKPTDVCSHPWIQAYPKEIPWNSDIPVTTLPLLLGGIIEKYALRQAMSFMGRTWTYQQLGEMVDRFADALQDHGIGKGMRVGLCLPNTPFYVVAYYGVLKAGGVVVNFNPLYAEDEIAYQIDDSDVAIMVTLNVRQILPKVEKMLERTALEKIIVCDLVEVLPLLKGIAFRALNYFKGFSGKADLVKVEESATHLLFNRLLDDAGQVPYTPVEITPDDVAVLQYTGGTTGVPKAAVLSHGNLTANVHQAHMWFMAGQEPKEQERMLIILPFFHVFSMTVQMNLAIKMGGVLIMLPSFTPEGLLNTIDTEKPTLFAGVPSIYKRIMEHPKFKTYDLSSLRICMSGGAALPVPVQRDWKEATGLDMLEGYGLSETSPLALANPVYGEKKESAVGVPLPGTEVMIANLEYPDKAMPQGEKGEICIRGPQVMQGYWKRQDETVKVMGTDGFLHTGDVGYMDEDGYVFIVDRVKDLIIGDNGLNIFPRKVEDAIHQHPAVAEVVVAGVQDEARGEVTKAWVVLKTGQEATATDLKDFLKDKLAAYEMPRSIVFRKDLPKTMIGKPDKKVLRAGG